MKYSEPILQELKDCKAGEQIRLTFTSQASVGIMSEAEYRRWKAETRTSYFIGLISDDESDSEACFTIPADGNYYLCIESHDDCPRPELKSIERKAVDTFIFNGENEQKKIVRRVPGEDTRVCSIPQWEKKVGIALRDPFVCFSCNTVRPASSLRCIPVKIASFLERDIYSVPVCPECLKKAEGHAFITPALALVRVEAEKKPVAKQSRRTYLQTHQ